MHPVKSLVYSLAVRICLGQLAIGHHTPRLLLACVLA